MRHDTNNYAENWMGTVKKDFKPRTRNTAGEFIRAQYVTVSGLITEVHLTKPDAIPSKMKTKKRGQMEEKWKKRKKTKGRGKYFGKHQLETSSSTESDNDDEKSMYGKAKTTNDNAERQDAGKHSGKKDRSNVKTDKASAQKQDAGNKRSKTPETDTRRHSKKKKRPETDTVGDSKCKFNKENFPSGVAMYYLEMKKYSWLIHVQLIIYCTSFTPSWQTTHFREKCKIMTMIYVTF
jgi:hypothetical protein